MREGMAGIIFFPSLCPISSPGGVKVKGHWGFRRLHRIQVDSLSVGGRPRRGEYVLKGRAGSSG